MKRYDTDPTLTATEAVETAAIFVLVERGHDFDDLCAYFASNIVWYEPDLTWPAAVQVAVNACESWIASDNAERLRAQDRQ